eukprot:CAMPEP_0116561218 /NCGR_PEP_ID=MMETSP0397-20121206/11454_1 /TAXON_ID=216820 /ORGANISM="Cyclophora tenuis, Strain ECT3854" /LENGTH=350 /DNA_ID=CAMNT_0004087323 /DNA_START=30 /DNA_END=1082 /DNA_ORIENTATION=-
MTRGALTVLLLSHILVLLFVRVYSQIADDGSGLCPCANCPDRCASTCGEDSLPPECISMRCYTGYGTCDDAIPGLEDLISAQHNFEMYESSSRIIGGKTVAEGKYPFFAQYGVCGGSLIYPDVVLTAAHCQAANLKFKRDHYPDLDIDHVYIGSTKRFDRKTGERIRIYIDREHPDYGNGVGKTVAQQQNNDFMLLFLDEASKIKPVQLTFDAKWLTKKKTMAVIGTGSTTRQLSMKHWEADDQLNLVILDVASPQSCSAKWKKVNKDTQFCLKSTKSKDSCQGDSGGPVIFKHFFKLYQIGVVSFGDENCATGEPAVYGLVKTLEKWIFEERCYFSTDYKPENCPKEMD